MRLEFLLALFSNLRGLFLGLVVVSAVCAIFSTILSMSIREDLGQAMGPLADRKRESLQVCVSVIHWAVPLTIVFGLLACIPNVQELWAARIGLIKLELASPENVKKGAEEIARIAHKLECKYIGCSDEEKKENP